MITAFQIGAYQFTAFQEGLGVGTGDVSRLLLLRQIARMRRKAKERIPAEVLAAQFLEQAQAAVREARAITPLNLRPLPRITDLRPLAEAMRQRQLDGELRSFREMLEALADVEEEIA